MWIYVQRSGEILWDGKHVAYGYSGADSGKNIPEMQDHPNLGPIPQGNYTIGSPRDTETHGPFVLSLSPDRKNEMYGRSGFLIHGDSLKAPGTASQGCIIASRFAREWMWKSQDHSLRVVSDHSSAPDVDGEISV